MRIALGVSYTVPASDVVPNVVCNKALAMYFSLFRHSLASAGTGQASSLLFIVLLFVEFQSSGRRHQESLLVGTSSFENVWTNVNHSLVRKAPDDALHFKKYAPSHSA